MAKKTRKNIELGVVENTETENTLDTITETEPVETKTEGIATVTYINIAKKEIWISLNGDGYILKSDKNVKVGDKIAVLYSGIKGVTPIKIEVV